jgi:hypothetical protein
MARRQDDLASASTTATFAVCNNYACITSGSSVGLVDLSSGALHPLPVQQCTCASFASAGGQLLTGGDDKCVRLWATSPPPGDGTAPLCSWTHSKKIGCVAFSPDGKTALWADLFGEVYAVELGSAPTAPALILGHLSPINHLLFSACGGALLTADREGHLRSSVWPHTFVIECYYLEHTKPVRAATAPIIGSATTRRCHRCTRRASAPLELGHSPSSPHLHLPYKPFAPFAPLSQLSLVLSLTDSPLVLTVPSDGHEVCLWRSRTGALLGRTSAAQLCGVDPADPATGPAIACGCELATMGLVAMAFQRSSLILFCSPHLTKPSDGAQASAHLSPRPELACQLPEGCAPPVCVAYSAAASLLCALLDSRDSVVLVPAASGHFNAAAARVVRFAPEVPRAAPTGDAVVDEDEGEEGQEKRARME